MQRTTVEPRTVVYEIVCDRCRKEIQRDGNDFELMTSFGFQAGYASIFGDGNRVEIDLCEPCLRDTLGTWLRVTTPADTATLSRMLEEFKPEVHGGEFSARDLHGPGELAELAQLADPAKTVAAAPPPGGPTRFPDSWVPVAELFNRLADGATLEQIEGAFPAISRNAASHALREAALRFPSYACFHPAVDVWTPRYPHER